MPGRPSSPYLINTLFIEAVSSTTAKNGVYKIYIPSALYYTNTGLTINNVQVNFDNGAGFVTAAINSTVIANYTTVGNKNWYSK